MVSLSRASEIRGRALMLAASRGLDLSGRVPLAATAAADLAQELGRAKRVMMVARTLCGLAEAVTAHVPPDGPQMRLVDGESVALDDFATDPTVFDRELRAAPVAGWLAFRDRVAELEARRVSHPLVADRSVDLLVHDLVANRLDDVGLARCLAESFRVLAADGTLCVVALIADEPITIDRLRIAATETELCRLPVEGALLGALLTAGFHGLQLRALYDAPVLVHDGAEVRAFVIRAFKGTKGPCWEEGDAVLYTGPWSSVTDDDNHVYRRGERAAVCRKTFELLARAPYRGQFIHLPRHQVAAALSVVPFDCNTPAIRPPAVTKGRQPVRPAPAEACCEGASTMGSCC